VRNNDRHLFLETILSAREVLYISYCSRDEKDAAMKPPSSLVDELIDYVAKGMEGQPDTDKLRKDWVVQHPLHGFNRIYFDGTSELKNYLPESRFSTGIQVAEGQPKTQTFDLSDVDIDRLADFLKNPPKTFLQRQFGVSYFDEELLLPEHEVFELDQLKKHRLKQDLLGMTPEELRAYATTQKCAGKLPLQNMGIVQAEHLYQEMVHLQAYFQAACKGRTSRYEDLKITLPQGRLLGRISGIYGDDYIVVCTSSNHLKYLLSGYVRFLALRASKLDINFVFITIKFDGIHVIESVSITPSEALDLLQEFVNYYREGHSNYFLFYPNLARKQFEMLSGGYDFLLEQYEALEDQPMNFEFEDEYFLKAVEHGFFSEEGFDTLRKNVFQIMRPIEKSLPILFTVPK
jgi:exodeoxyribonuclease V gamma subunit